MDIFKEKIEAERQQEMERLRKLKTGTQKQSETDRQTDSLSCDEGLLHLKCQPTHSLSVQHIDINLTLIHCMFYRHQRN